VKVPSDRVIDGRSLLPLMRSAAAKSPHDAIFAMQGANLAIIRSGRWKLHVRAPQPGQKIGVSEPEAMKWVDPRGPDGVTLIAQYEQARPHQYPGLSTGDPASEMMLFDMEVDRGEQHDVAAKHPEVVARLKKMFDQVNADVKPVEPRRPPAGPRGIRRLKGGSLQYDMEPAVERVR
jgi:uncharacterized sulfatase